MGTEGDANAHCQQTRLSCSSARLQRTIDALTATSLAQVEPAEAGIADIIVTAQKREQSLQDAPISVTALVDVIFNY